MQLLPGVPLSDGCPPLNVAGAGSIRSTSWGGLQLSSGVLLKDDLRMLPVLEVSGQLQGGVAAVVRCPFER